MKKTLAILAMLVVVFGLIRPACAQSFLTNGLVAYFPFDGDANDYSTNGNSGTLFGNTAFAVDRFGRLGSCLQLFGEAGTTSGVDVPSLDAMPYYPVTYSAWVWISNLPPVQSLTVMSLVGREECGQQSDGAVTITSAPGVQLTNGFDYFQGSKGFYRRLVAPVQQWCQIVVTITSNGATTLYLNGTNLITTNTAISGVHEDFRIGCSAQYGNCGYQYVWNGLIDDVRIYNRALSSNEVGELYEFEAPPCGPSATAVATVLNGFVVGATVTSGGCGFTNTPVVAFVGGGGAGAAGVANVTNGSVVSITITHAGNGYSSPPTILIGGAPTIVTQPPSITVTNGAPAELSVLAGGAALGYQWYFDGSPINGATNSQIYYSSVDFSYVGTYSVLITNYFGTVASSNAVFEVYPYFETTLAPLSTYWGETNELSVQVEGAGNLTYQWYDNGRAIAGATDSDLVFSGIQTSNSGAYYVVVTSDAGRVTNGPVEVSVSGAPLAIHLSPTVTISGVVGNTYAIQRTPDFTSSGSWVTVTNLTLTSQVETWADTTVNSSFPGSPKQYYRVLPGSR